MSQGPGELAAVASSNETSENKNINLNNDENKADNNSNNELQNNNNNNNNNTQTSLNTNPDGSTLAALGNTTRSNSLIWKTGLSNRSGSSKDYLSDNESELSYVGLSPEKDKYSLPFEEEEEEDDDDADDSNGEGQQPEKEFLLKKSVTNAGKHNGVGVGVEGVGEDQKQTKGEIEGNGLARNAIAKEVLDAAIDEIGSDCETEKGAIVEEYERKEKEEVIRESSVVDDAQVVQREDFKEPNPNNQLFENDKSNTHQQQIQDNKHIQNEDLKGLPATTENNTNNLKRKFEQVGDTNEGTESNNKQGKRVQTPVMQINEKLSSETKDEVLDEVRSIEPPVDSILTSATDVAVVSPAPTNEQETNAVPLPIPSEETVTIEDPIAADAVLKRVEEQTANDITQEILANKQEELSTLNEPPVNDESKLETKSLATVDNESKLETRSLSTVSNASMSITNDDKTQDATVELEVPLPDMSAADAEKTFENAELTMGNEVNGEFANEVQPAIKEGFGISVDQESQRLKGYEAICEIETDFANLRQEIYENKIQKLKMELQMCLDGSHSALQKYLAQVQEIRDEKLKKIYLKQQYRLDSIDRETRATRYILHQDFYKKTSDLKEALLNETTKQWYDINNERRDIDLMSNVSAAAAAAAHKDAHGANDLDDVEEERINLMNMLYSGNTSILHQENKYHVPIKILNKSLSMITGYSTQPALEIDQRTPHTYDTTHLSSVHALESGAAFSNGVTTGGITKQNFSINGDINESSNCDEDRVCENINWKFVNNPVDKLEVIVDRMRFNNMISDFQGLKKYYGGFPSAPELPAIKELELVQDFTKIHNQLIKKQQRLNANLVPDNDSGNGTDPHTDTGGVPGGAAGGTAKLNKQKRKQ